MSENNSNGLMSKMTKAELQKIAEESGLEAKSSLTKAELIAMLEDLGETKETVAKQQQEIDELKEIIKNQNQTTDSIQADEGYSANWIIIIWVNLFFPIFVLIGMFYWPILRKLGRHEGRYFWAWFTILGQVLTLIVFVLYCFLIIPLVFIPSMVVYMRAINEGREDRYRR